MQNHGVLPKILNLLILQKNTLLKDLDICLGFSQSVEFLDNEVKDLQNDNIDRLYDY